jgi:curved DNA-binding protein CbpA
MKNPFQVLAVPETADDEEIKKAYLRMVRQYPPDRAPKEFQRIRQAFETIETRRDRLRYQLFHSEPPDLSVLLQARLRSGSLQRPTLELLQKTLSQTLTERS